MFYLVVNNVLKKLILLTIVKAYCLLSVCVRMYMHTRVCMCTGVCLYVCACAFRCA